ncbi:hypothetical protein FG08087.1 [Paecilomyces variotii No. 5]|uniref:Uncharacterized protein n=1 Tax=Byssochlamys spectabilis (strain No. 5 / NBRC 109023) TaxID=1356009 RepID=V5GBY5_BYSSN|nr:hypothetical protein FG08087.1 [Paecilomyces variotii No. 5]
MKFTLLPLALSAMLSLSSALPSPPHNNSPTTNLSKRADCLVNAALIDVWHEAGLQRRRTAFSSEGTNAVRCCDFYRDGYLHVQEENPPTESQYNGYADSSYVLGPLGDANALSHTHTALNGWIEETQCTTGP